MGGAVYRVYQTEQTDDPDVTLDYLKNETVGHRVLVLITHGTGIGSSPRGEPRFDVFNNEIARDIAYGQYLNEGFFPGEIGRRDNPPSIVLYSAGIRNHFRSGHFADDAIIHGNYCYSLDRWADWSGGEISSFTGYEQEFNYSEACDDLREIQSRMGCYRYPWYGKGVGAAVRSQAPLFAKGDLSNSYDCERGCLEVIIDDPMARIRQLPADSGILAWEAIEEKGTMAYRILGSENYRSALRSVVGAEIPARGSGSRYSLSLPQGWNVYHLQEKELVPGGYRWNEVEAVRGLQANGESMALYERFPTIQVVGSEDERTDIEKYVALMKTNGIDASYEIVEKPSGCISRNMAGENDTVRITWKASRNNTNINNANKNTHMQGTKDTGADVLIVAPSQFTMVEHYANALLQHDVTDSVAILYVDYPEITDSSEIAARIIGGEEKYVLLFGEVGWKNGYGATIPHPWIEVEGGSGYHSILGVLDALSFWDWEENPSTSRVDKVIGLIPVTYDWDVLTYKYKMLAAYENGGSSGYERSFGTWVDDEDNWGNSGSAVRMAMQEYIDNIHPSWAVKESYCQMLCMTSQAAISSTPSTNFTPAITLASN